MAGFTHWLSDRTATAALAGLLAAVAVQGAQAAPTNGELLTNCNAIAGSFSSSSESEGAVVVGSSSNAGNFNHSSMTPPARSRRPPSSAVMCWPPAPP